jgi:hypothetical protein
LESALKNWTGISLAAGDLFVRVQVSFGSFRNNTNNAECTLKLTATATTNLLAGLFTSSENTPRLRVFELNKA